MRLAVLASHAGTTLQAVLEACEQGALDAEVVLVISNNSGAGAIKKADDAGVKTRHISTKTHVNDHGVDTAMLAAFREAEVDWILLLGYMKKLGSATLDHYAGKILNTHPALLPKFGGKGFFGRSVHEAVLAAGEKETGATLHLVDQEYDSGPPLSQVTVPVMAGDTVDSLEARVKRAERNLIIQTLKTLKNDQAV